MSRDSTLFFFLMIRRPPRSTLFPYRRSSDLSVDPAEREEHDAKAGLARMGHFQRVEFYKALQADEAGDELPDNAAAEVVRSEEHTSELQSRRDLVCRLLLEKKKYNKESEHL